MLEIEGNGDGSENVEGVLPKVMVMKIVVEKMKNHLDMILRLKEEPRRKQEKKVHDLSEIRRWSWNEEEYEDGPMMKNYQKMKLKPTRPAMRKMKKAKKKAKKRKLYDLSGNEGKDAEDEEGGEPR